LDTTSRRGQGWRDLAARRPRRTHARLREPGAGAHEGAAAHARSRPASVDRHGGRRVPRTLMPSNA